MEKNEEVMERTRGTPQAGVVSPILLNLVPHCAFDFWMTRTYPDLSWCRYADDGLVHCRSEQQAEALKAALNSRLCLLWLTTSTAWIMRKFKRFQSHKTRANLFLRHWPGGTPAVLALAGIRNEYFCLIGVV